MRGRRASRQLCFQLQRQFLAKKNHHRRVRIWHGSTLRSTHPSIPRAREFWPQAREELGGWGELFFVGTHLTGKKSGTITKLWEYFRDYGFVVEFSWFSLLANKMHFP